MNIITESEYVDELVNGAKCGTLDEQTDNHGQVIIYTGFFQWSDGSIRREMEPNHQDVD